MSADPKAPEPGRAPASPLSLPRITDGERERIGGFVEAVNAEPPATPEPAALPPRVPDDRLAAMARACVLECGFEPEGITYRGYSGLVLDLRDARASETALRAKVAELEARIAELRISYQASENLRQDGQQRNTHAGIRFNEERGKREAAEAALARANEALSAALDFDATPGAVSGLAKVAALERLRQALVAQGSAAQKPEGP